MWAKLVLHNFSRLPTVILIPSRYLYRGINEAYLQRDRRRRIMAELDQYDADVSEVGSEY